MTTSRYDWSDGVAAEYGAARALGSEARDQWREALDGIIGAADLVLDLGCGVGLYTRYLAEWFSCDVIGCDPSADMLQAAPSDVPARGWLQASAHALPFVTGVIDVVWLSNVVHHLDLTAASGEIDGVLAAGGRVVIRNVFPDHAEQMPLYNFFPEARLLDEASYPTIADTCRAFASVGLDLVKRQTVTQVTAPTWTDYFERTGRRAVSSLRLIADQEFAVGLKRLERHALVTSGEVVTPMELLVFARG